MFNELGTAPPLVRLDDFSTTGVGKSWRFSGYVRTVAAMTPEEVQPLLVEIEGSAAEGLFAAGFIAYEAARGINPDLPALPPAEGLPLAWFAVFRERWCVPAGEGLPDGAGSEAPEVVPAIAPADYRDGVDRIKEYIASGDCYQVNYTFPQSGNFTGDPLSLYGRVAAGQQAPYAAYLDTGRFTIVSASPELFFTLESGAIRVRPMKGTARRGRWPAEDRELANALAASEKERAENLMIVDLLRNDLGVVADTGSVRVESLFDIESYPTVHQMTSTASAHLQKGIGLSELFAALFPCGSVTGAPKRRSMELIAGLEGRPRGCYCGAIGHVGPGGEATFSVAIRTLLLDRFSGILTLGVGSGITWGSVPREEFAECLGKAEFIREIGFPLVLIETMGWEEGGVRRLERHLVRMAASAAYFGFPFDKIEAERLLGTVQGDQGIPLRVRLTLDRDGRFAITVTPLEPCREPLRIAVADSRIDPADRYRYHKTSHRNVLDAARVSRSDCDEVIFLNSRDELTEGSYHSLVLKKNGRLVTPGLASGLLPGILRGEMLERGEIEEATLYLHDLLAAEEIWLINSLRGRRRAVLIEGEPP